MARDLEITVTVDASQAKRELGQVDTSVQNVTKSGSSLDQATQKIQSSLNKLDSTKVVELDAAMAETTATVSKLPSATALATASIQEMGLAAGVSADVMASLAPAIVAVGAAALPLVAIAAALAAGGALFVGWYEMSQEAALGLQTMGAAQDTINIAIARGADVSVGFAQAMQFNDEWVQRHTASIKGNSEEVEANIKRQEEFTVVIDRVAHDIVPYATAEMLELNDKTHQYAVTLNGPATDAVKKWEDLLKKQATDTIPSWIKAMDEWDKVTGSSSRGLEGLASQGGAVSRSLGTYIDYAQRAKDADKAHEAAIKQKRVELIALFNADQAVYDEEDRLNRIQELATNATITRSLAIREHLLPALGDWANLNAKLGGDLFARPTTGTLGTLPADHTPGPLVTSIRDQITDGVKSSFSNLPTILQHAFEGSGGIAGAFKSLGVQLADAIITPLLAKLNKLGQGAVGVGSSVAGMVGGQVDTAGAIVGATAGSIGGAVVGSLAVVQGLGTLASAAAIGAATAGIGLAAVAAYYGLKKLFTASEESKALQKAQDTLIDQLKQMATKSQIAAGALTDNYHTIAIVARDAFMDYGLSAQDAGVKVAALLNTHNAHEFAMAMADLGAVLDYNATKLKLIDQYTKDTDEAIGGVNDAMKKWGLTINDLGPAFKQQNLDKLAGSLLKDYTLLTAAGGDSVTVLEHMNSGFQELVTASFATGTAIPENLKPAIQKLIDLGDLTDGAGHKLTDVGDLQWTTPLDEQFKTLLKHIDDLVNALTYDLTGAINGLPDKTVHINITGDSINDLVGRGDTANDAPPEDPSGHYSTGGIVGVTAQYFGNGGNVLAFPGRPIGGDRIPVWAREDEMFLTTSQQRAVGALMQKGGGAGSSGGETVIHAHLHLDGREIATSLERIQDKNLRTRRKTRAA